MTRTTAGALLLSAGLFLWPGTAITSIPIVGGCCFGDGTCVDVSGDECTAAGGSYQGDGALCSSITCPVDNVSPDCRNALADPAEIWPPNHRFRDVSVVGVTDPDGDPVTITVGFIHQDEPVDDKGDGRSKPDGHGLGTSTAAVRAERSGSPTLPGDGRVYHVSFTADDGMGGECSGTVTVCVPHDQSDGCVDQGPIFDSTGDNGFAMVVPN